MASPNDRLTWRSSDRFGGALDYHDSAEFLLDFQWLANVEGHVTGCGVQF
jgi:hypothetical protein